MTDSIITAVSRFLTPELIGKIASATGLDSATTQKAANASVPAILGGLADLASKPGGARQLASAIAEQPAGLLSTLTNAMGGNAQLQDKGSTLLASLLGGGALGTLVSSVSRFAGIGEGSARSLMGLLTPVVLGVLGREQRAAGMEASGLARMLLDQKDQIAAAMPAGLSSMLGAAGKRESGAPHRLPRPASTMALKRPTLSIARLAQMCSGRSARRRADRTTAGRTGPCRCSRSQDCSGTCCRAVMPPIRRLRRNRRPHRLLCDCCREPTTSRSISPGLLAGWSSIGAYHNQEIYNRSGESIGVIKDLLVGPDGKINAAVIGVGRFLGMGEKDVAVPLALLQVERRDNSGRLIMDVARDILRTAPAFEPSGTGGR